MRSDWSSRSSGDERSAPPLWAMPAAVALALALLAATAGLLALELNRKYLRQEKGWRQRLSTLSASVPSGETPPLRVVAVGTSQFRAGLLPDAEMEALASRRCLRPVRFVRMARDSGDYPRWESLWREVRAARPDVLLLDAHLLFYRPRPWPFYSRLLWSSFRIPLVARLRGLPESPPKPGPGRPEVWRPAWTAMVRDFRCATLDFGLREGMEDLLGRFRREGIRVIALPLPMAPESAGTRGPGEAAAIRRDLQRLEREGLLQVRQCPLPFGREEYADPTHLSAAGQERYSEWLAGRLCTGVP